MNKQIWAGLGVIILASAVWFAVENRGKDDKKEQAMMMEEKMEDKDDKMMKDEQAVMVKAGVYADYSTARVEEEQQAGRKVVLFFHANWCPECRAADADFKANSSKIPQGVALLKLDYDTQTDLKSKYGVTYQHTFVQIDASGNLVTKWVSGDTALLAKNIK